MRKLSPQEVESLGLRNTAAPAAEAPVGAKPGRKLSPEEVQQLGLPTKPAPPGGDDLDAELEARLTSESPDPEWTKNPIVRGALQGSTLNFADEIGGGMQAIMAALDGDPETGVAQTYRQARYENRQDDKAAGNDSPLAYGGGQLGGAVLSPINFLMPGSAAGAKAAQVASAAGKTGSFLGALSALGASEAETLPEQALDTVKGGVVGGVGGYGAGKFLGAPLQAASDRASQLSGVAGNMALGGTGANVRQMVKEAGGNLNRASEVGQTLVQKRLIPWFAKAGGKAIKENIDGAIPPGTAARDTALRNLDATDTPIDLRRIMETLDEKFVDPKLASELGETRALGGKVHEALGEIADVGSVPPSHAQSILGDVQGLAYPRGGQGSPVYQEFAPGLRRALREEFGSIDSTEGQAYSAAQDELSKLLAAKRVVDSRAPMQMGNSPIGLMNTVAGASAGGASYAATGQPVTAALTGLGSAFTAKIIRERGPALAANTFDRLAQVLRADPGAGAFGRFGNALVKAAQRGPEALYATHRALMTSDPEYYEAWLRQADSEAVE
jgi:hypothetical protein